jgi:ZIP family zinc transporter
VAILVALGSVVATVVGGVVALRSRDRLHLILGFSAGVLLGVIAFDLIPEVADLAKETGANMRWFMVAFAAGFLVLHVLERAVSLHHAHEQEYAGHRHDPSLGVISALALAAHSFMDGFAIGIGFQAGTMIGVLVATAVIAHDFCDGLNTVSVMRIHGAQRRPAQLMLGLDAIAPLLGAATAGFIHVPTPVLGAYLAFFAGFLLYIATGDILPEAHTLHPSRMTLGMTVLGTAAIGAVVSVMG